jgi:hypothetical protein
MNTNTAGEPLGWQTMTAGNTDSISGNWIWSAPYQQVDLNIDYFRSTPVITERVIERIIEKHTEKKPMRGLFSVHVVDPDKGKVVASRLLLVAKSESNARLKAISEIAATDEFTRDVDDYDIIVVRLGDVRAKKEVQEVKVIKDD